MANKRYATKKIVRLWKRSSCMALALRVGRAHTLHPVVEDEAHQQDDQEVDQREGRGRPQVELAHRLLGEELAEEGGGVARPAARQYERLGVDHEAVHEARSE